MIEDVETGLCRMCGRRITARKMIRCSDGVWRCATCERRMRHETKRVPPPSPVTPHIREPRIVSTSDVNQPPEVHFLRRRIDELEKLDRYRCSIAGMWPIYLAFIAGIASRSILAWLGWIVG